ncbi:mannosyl-glycoprotein endo-beta-N-acetylglucosamidase, partial [Parageobacillus sp. SY1]
MSTILSLWRGCLTRMEAQIRKFLALLSILLLLVSYGISPAYAANTPANTGEEANTYVQVTSETAPVKQTETNQQVGELAKGTILKAVKLENNRVYIQWGTELAYLDRTDVQNAVLSEPLTSYTYEEKAQSTYVLVKEKAAVYTKNGQLIGYLMPEQQYPVSQELDDAFEIIIGNQLGYMKKSPSISVTEPNDQTASDSEETKNTDTAPTNGTETSQPITETKQPETETNTTEANKSATTNQTAARASIASTNQTTAAPFTASTKYFQVVDDQVAVYDNSTGKLVQVGTLEKGQEFPRIKDYGNWHQI